MGVEAVQRNLEMLQDRIAGSTLQEIADEHGVTPQAVHVIVDRTMRRHVEEVLLGMWAAQKDGQLLVLAVPPGLAHEQALTVRYLDFMLGELAELHADVQVHYRPAGFDGGFVLALEDRNFHPKEHPR
jgi:predicted transcriptional regulator